MLQKSALVVSSCVAVMVSGCGLSFVTGSGRAAEEVRAVGSFRTSSIGSGIRATVVKGPPGVTLTADDNVLPEVETVLEGQDLVVRVRPYTSIDSRLGITAVISGDVLEGLDASGGANVTATATPVATFPLNASGGSHVQLAGLDATDVVADVSGGSHATLTGRTQTLKANASGASTVDARALNSTTATVDASGASSLDLFVTSRVDGSLSGSSRLTWAGGAPSDVETSGGSTASPAR